MYRIEWTWSLAPLGVLALLMVPVVGALLVTAAILAALVGAIVAPPLLLFRAVRRHKRSGPTSPADTERAKAESESALAAAKEQAAIPEAPAAPVR